MSFICFALRHFLSNSLNVQTLFKVLVSATNVKLWSQIRKPTTTWLDLSKFSWWHMSKGHPTELKRLVVLLLVLLMFWWCLDYPRLPLVSDQGRGLLSTGGLLAGWRSEARARHPALSLPPTPAPVVPGTQLTQNWAPTIKISQLWIFVIV